MSREKELNLDLLGKMRDAIKDSIQEGSLSKHLPEMNNPQFDMTTVWFEEKHRCRTGMCMVGLVLSLNGLPIKQLRMLNNSAGVDAARDILGLTMEEGDRLFFAEGSSAPWSHVTAEMAVYALDSLILTGVVMWPGQFPPSHPLSVLRAITSALSHLPAR